MTDWEALYQAGDTGWDKGRPSPGLVAALAEAPPMGLSVLVPGCGRGHEIDALLDAGAGSVVGLDIAPSAVTAAQARLGDRAQALLGDLFALPAEMVGAFDLVVEHTCFCAIPRARRDDYVRAVATALKPGGELLALFYLTPRDDPDPTLGPPFGVDVEELERRFFVHFEIVSRGAPAAAFPERAGREQLWRLRRRTPVLRPDQVTAEWLAQTLGRPVDRVELRTEASSWAQQIPLTLWHTGDPAPRALRLKVCAGDTFGPSEVEYYRRDYVDVPDAPLVRCVDAAWAPGHGYHILLDDLSATHRNRWDAPPTREFGIAVAEALAALHARWWEADPVPEGAIDRYFAHVRPGLEPLIAATHPGTLIADRIRGGHARHEAALRARFADPRGMTRLHGDPNPGNILTPHDAEGPALLLDRQPFDWSLTVGPALFDLAYFLALWWPTDARRAHQDAILAAWQAALARRGVVYDDDALRADWRLCVRQQQDGPIEWCSVPDDVERMRWVWEPQWSRVRAALEELEEVS